MKQSTLRTAKTMQVVNGVSHAKLVENRVTLQAPEPEFKSAGLQAFKTSCTDVMNFVTSTSEFCHRVSLVAISSTCYQNTKAIELMSEEAMLAPMEQVMAEAP